MRKVIYIASPYTHGDQADNVRAQIDAAHKIMDLGHTPSAPLLSHLMAIVRQRPYEEWIQACLSLIPKMDAVFRLPSDKPSEGADREVAEARKLGIPVFFSWETLEEWLANSAPRVLFHVTTGRKVKLYRQTGRINAPVRGFDTLSAAMAWAMKTGRKVILRCEVGSLVSMLPDHHNEFGTAWWTTSVPVANMKCVYSAEGAHPPEQPGTSTHPTPPKKGYLRDCNFCPRCGGTMIGDGCHTVTHCENADEASYEYAEPDAGPIYCNHPDNNNNNDNAEKT